VYKIFYIELIGDVGNFEFYAQIYLTLFLLLDIQMMFSKYKMMDILNFLGEALRKAPVDWMDIVLNYALPMMMTLCAILLTTIQSFVVAIKVIGYIVM